MANFEKTCRTCMRSDGSLVDLFGPLKIENSSRLKLADVLMEAIPLQITQEDGLPQKLCDKCTNIIQIFHTFRTQALHCDNELKQLMPTATIKKENADAVVKFENEYIYSTNYDNYYYDNVVPNFEHEVHWCKTCNKVYNQHHILLGHSCKKKVGVLECPICINKFSSKQQFKLHMNNHFEKNEYVNTVASAEESDDEVGVKWDTQLNLKCPECALVYHSEKSLLLHLEKHKGTLKGEPFKCNKCGEQFILATSFIEHKNRHMYDSRYDSAYDNRYDTVFDTEYDTEYDSYRLRCLQCYITFRNEDQLERHNMECHRNYIKQDNLFTCSTCSLEFDSYNSLESHFKEHAISIKEKKKFKCDHCDKGFTSKGPLKRHLALHSEDRPFRCTECPKRYSRQDALVTHMRKHNGIKPYACQHCDKAFNQLCSLKDHIRTHTGETPFLCSECGKGFNNSSNLRQHLRRHTGIKPFACTLCPKTFCTKGQMKCHTDTHLDVHPYQCSECGATFTKPNSLKKHKMIHLGIKPFACDSCNMSFTCKDHLKRHQRKHTGEKPYKCTQCERAFTQSNDLIKHMRRHMGQDIYSCTVCGAKFRLMRELKRHYPIHYTGTETTTLMEKPLIVVKESNNMENTNTAEGQITITFNRNLLDKDSSGDITINIGAERIN